MQMASISSARRCVFCGASPPLTKEHVFPKWLREAVTWSKNNVGTHVWKGERSRAGKVYQGVSIMTEARIVCGTCNNGWMRKLEDAVIPILKPMVQGQVCMLDQAAQALLATWCFKTVMVIEHIDPPTQIPREHLSYLYQDQERRPPLFSYAWISSYWGGSVGLSFNFSPSISEVRSNGLSLPVGEKAKELGFSSGSYLYLATLAIDKWVTQILWTESPEFGEFIAAQPDSKRFLQIWPTTTRAISWPTGGVALTDLDDLAIFENRLTPFGLIDRIPTTPPPIPPRPSPNEDGITK